MMSADSPRRDLRSPPGPVMSGAGAYYAPQNEEGGQPGYRSPPPPPPTGKYDGRSRSRSPQRPYSRRSPSPGSQYGRRRMPRKPVYRGTEEERSRSSTLFVGNIPYRYREADLQDLVAAYGAVAKVTLPMDRQTGNNKGYAFIEFVERAAAEEASDGLRALRLEDRDLRIDWDIGRESKGLTDSSDKTGDRSIERPGYSPAGRRGQSPIGRRGESPRRGYSPVGRRDHSPPPSARYPRSPSPRRPADYPPYDRRYREKEEYDYRRREAPAGAPSASTSRYPSRDDDYHRRDYPKPASGTGNSGIHSRPPPPRDYPRDPYASRPSDRDLPPPSAAARDYPPTNRSYGDRRYDRH